MNERAWEIAGSIYRTKHNTASTAPTKAHSAPTSTPKPLGIPSSLGVLEVIGEVRLALPVQCLLVLTGLRETHRSFRTDWERPSAHLTEIVMRP